MQTKPLLKEKLDGPEKIIATELIKMCGIPGCLPVLHKEDALKIMIELEKEGYKIKRERN